MQYLLTLTLHIMETPKMAISINKLSSILTLTEPLGPIAHERIIDDEYIGELIDDKISLFRDVTQNHKPHMLLLGRKGAGKSALLSDIRLGVRKQKRRGMRHPDGLLPTGEDYVLEVSSWEHFHSIVRNVSGQIRRDDALLEDLIPPEYFIDLWYEMLWDEIIQYFYNYSHYEECQGLLDHVNKYVKVDGYFDGDPSQRAKDLFSAAQLSILGFLEQRNSKLYFLFDSMDKYPVRNITFSKILAGLFQGLIKINDETDRIYISFCIPEEIEAFIAAGSANLIKDLSSAYRIRWKPIDLIRIVAHRLRLSAKVHDKSLFNSIKDHSFSKREDLQQLFKMVLPTVIVNSQGTEEDPLAYIVRHTQLLPRHILAIFNSSLRFHYQKYRTFTAISETAVRDGISNVQKIIANHILTPYEQLYPGLLATCRRVLPDLDPISSYSQLRKIEDRFNRGIEDDIPSVWDALFEIGVLGRSTGRSGTHHHDIERNDRYCYGQFHFNIDGSFGLATDGEYCFHPVFSREFGMVRRSPDKRVVYPANINLEGIYDENDS